MLSIGSVPVQAAAVNVTINGTTPIRTLTNELFGQNMSVYDSTLQPTAAGYAQATAALNAMGAGVLRFPGGGYGDMLDWSNIEAGNWGGGGAGGACVASTWMVNMQEGIALANAGGVKLQCIVNYGGRWCPTTGPNHTAAATKAADWVRYMNITGGGAHKVTYWEIGNEIFFNQDPGYEVSGTTYGANFVNYWNAMKAVDPTIKIGAMCQFDYATWSQDALTRIRQSIPAGPDFVIAHAYPIFNPTDSAAEDTNLLGAQVDAAATRNTEMVNILTAAGFSGAQAAAMPKWMTEFRSTVPENKAVEFVDAMWSAQYLLELGRLGWQGANIWAFKNGFSTGTTSDYGLLRMGSGNSDDAAGQANTPRPGWYIYPYLSRIFGRNLVDSTDNHALVRTWASRDASGNLTVFIVNNDTANAHTANLTISGLTAGANWTRWTMEPAGTTKSGGTTPIQQRRHMSVNGAVNPAVAAVPGAGAAQAAGAIPLPASSMVLLYIPVSGAGPTVTPTRTPTATATVCSSVFNGMNSAAQNGTWSGVNATRTFITTGFPAGALTEGSGLMRVQIAPTPQPTPTGYNADTMILTGFTPNVFTGAAQLTIDVNAEAALITALGSYHTVLLIGDSSTNSIYFQQLSSDTPNLVAGQQTLTFNLNYPGTLTSAMALSSLRLVINAQNAGAGNLYVDNMRLVNSCGMPTPTATPCVVLFNACENLTQNGNWTGANATRSIVTSPAAAVVQGTSALRALVTTPNSFNTDLFNLDTFAPGNWYGVTRFQASVYVEASLLAGTTYNQLLLYADSFPTATFQPISSSGPSLVAGTNTVVWNIDYLVPGTGVPSGITAGMPITKLIFVWNNGPVSTNVGSFYLDNLLMLRDGCLPTPTNTRTFTITRTPTVTPTLTPAVTSTPTRTATGTLTRTHTPSPTSPANTSTATATPTRTPSATPTSTRTATLSPTPALNTSTPTRTASSSATSTRTSTSLGSTSTATSTSSPTSTRTLTPTASPTSTRTSTMTASLTSTLVPGAATSTSTSTPSRTSTPIPATSTSSRTATQSATTTSTPSLTSSRTATTTATSSSTPIPGAPTATSTLTPSASSTATRTSTPSRTSTPVPATATLTSSPILSRTATPSATITATASQSSTPIPGASTSTSTSTPSRTSTPLPATSTSTPSSTSSRTATSSATTTASSTATASASQTSTLVPGAPTFTSTLTPSSSSTATRTSTAQATDTPTLQSTSTSTSSPTLSPTLVSALTATRTATQTATRTPTFTSTLTIVNTPTSTATRTATSTSSPIPTSTRTASATSSPTLTQTPTVTLTATLTVTSTPTVQPGATPILSSNPATTGNPISVLPQAFTGTSNVTIQIFTVGPRVVQTKDYGMMSNGWVTLELTDDSGQPLTGGLYYVKVTTKDGWATAKLLIVK